MDTALVKVGGRWRHRKSGGPPVRRVEPVESAGGAGGIFSGTPVNISSEAKRGELQGELYLLCIN